MLHKLKVIAKKRLRVHSILVIILLLLAGQLLPLFPTPHAYAFENNDSLPISEQQARTELYALAVCLNDTQNGGILTSSNPSAADITAHHIWEHPDFGVSVGYEISPSGTMQCADINYNAALGFLNDPKLATYEDFVNYLYSHQAGGYQLKAGASLKLAQKLLAEAAPRRQSASAVFGPQERERRTLVSLAQCVTAPSNPNIFDVKINGQPYNWRSGKDGNSEISVGNDWQSDGQLQCNTLVNILNTDYPNALQSLPNGVTLDTLFGNPQALDNGDTIAPAPGATTGNGGGADNSEPSCESTGNFNLAWIFCPVIEGLASTVDGIYSTLIHPLLTTKPIDLSNPQNDPTHTFAIWSNFRLYGNIFLIIALLVVVFGESISGGLIDAYTAKKILPRLLVAAILINISIYIVAIAVDVTNIMGNGIASLIQAPFHQAACASPSSPSTHFGVDQNCFALNISGASADIGGLGLTALVGTGAGGIWALAHGGAARGIAVTILGPLLEFLLITVFIPAFLTFIAIMVTVLLRRGIILFLVLISPVAFALYCLPNTEQYFRRWWDLLFRTLMIYPLIAVFFALGNVLSVTIGSTTSGIDKVFADFLAITALLVPLFLIPFSFRIAGGVLGRFHEFATNTRQRAHQGIIGSEQNPDSWRNRTRARLRQGRREAGLDTRIIGDSLRAVPGSRQWRRNWQARRTASRNLEGQQFLEHDAVALANKGNDQYLLAGANPRLARQMRDQAAAEGKEADVRSWDQAIAMANLMPRTPANRMAMAQEHAATGFQYAAGQEGYNQLAETMADITGAQLVRDQEGNVTGASGPRAGAYADAMDNAQFRLKGAGRWNLAGINRGAGYAPESGYDKASGYMAGQGKPESYQSGAEWFLGADLKAGDNSDSTTLATKLASNVTSGRTSVAQVAEWHAKLLDAQPQAVGGNKKEIDKQLQAIEQVANATPNDDAHLDTFVNLSDAVRRNRREMRRNIDPNLIDNDQ